MQSSRSTATVVGVSLTKGFETTAKPKYSGSEFTSMQQGYSQAEGFVETCPADFQTCFFVVKEDFYPQEGMNCS